MKFDLTTNPSSSYSGLNVVSTTFDVNQRRFFLFVIVQPANANQSVPFGVQPIVEVRDLGTGMRAHPLKERWTIAVSLLTAGPNGTLLGTKNVTVEDERATFTDLSISVFWTRYMIEFVSNFGQKVSKKTPHCFLQ